MSRTWTLVFWAWVISILSCGLDSSYAQDCHGGTDSCRTVVPSIDTLRSGDYSPSQYAYITVTCYHDPSPANAICAGGGNFDRILFGASGCTVTTDNGATLIHDHHGSGFQPDCFYRKNFGLNGVVDARQCGIYGDGIHDDGAALNTCLKIAAEENLSSDPLLQNLLHIVSTGGGVILANTTSINVPDNTELTCGGTGTGTSQASGSAKDDDYRIGRITNAIVLNPTSANSAPSRYCSQATIPPSPAAIC